MQMQIQMQGPLDILDASSVLRSPQWKTRFFRLDPALQLLELFRDNSLQQRKGKIQLHNATVATAEELGELLLSKKNDNHGHFPIEYTRRFVFRVTEELSGGGKKHFFLCADLHESHLEDTSNAAAAAKHQASREYLHQWINAIQQTITHGKAPSNQGLPTDLRSIHHKLEQYVDALHVSAQIVRGRLLDDGSPVYDITPVAWTLTREEADQNVPGLWQIAEYSCSWQLSRTLKQLQEFDAQLRLRFRDDLKDVVFPHSLAHNLLTRLSDTQLAKNATLLDHFLQQVLSVPCVTLFGSDGSAMLDYFLEMAPNLHKLRQQIQLPLAKRRLMTWNDRQVFLALQQAHQEEKRRAQRTDAENHRRQRKESTLSQEQERHHHHHHHHHHDHDHPAEPPVLDNSQEQEGPISPVSCESESLAVVDPVHERIARIGHKLLFEAFTSGKEEMRSPLTSSQVQ